MARRKRMIYEPPGSRKRRRNGGAANEPFLTRRMFIAKGGVIAVFSGLAARLGYLQLVKGDEYKTEAKDNVNRTEIIPAPRGVILDRLGRPLAENRRTWEVRVVKADLPDDDVEERRVLDTLASALELEDVLVIRPTAVPTGQRDTVFDRVFRLLQYKTDNDDHMRELARWKSETEKNYRLVLVAPLSIDDAAMFRAVSAELPGVIVMNEIDYLVGNVWAVKLPITIKTHVPSDVALTLQANLMYLPGVQVDDNLLSRYYPRGEVFSHVLGFVRPIDGAALDDLRNRDKNNERIYGQNDWIGKEGLEQALEVELRGVKGQRIVEVDNNGVVMRVMPNSEIQPKPGKSVRLSIDLELQRAVGNALQKGVENAAKLKKTNNDKRREEKKDLWRIPNSGAAVVYDPRNGEVLAMVSYPYYDNQLFITGISNVKWDAYRQEDKGKAFVNRVTNELYPPGSTFKIFLAASALEHGTLKPDQTHNCTGAIYLPPSDGNLANGNAWACWVGWNDLSHDPATLDLYGAIEQSCDTYFYNVAVAKSKWEESREDLIYYLDFRLLDGEVVSTEQHVFNGLGIDPLADDMQNKFWFGKATEIELLGEAIGLFPDRAWKQEMTETGEGWSVGETLNVSIGQGETQATPLQIVMNTAALANGGVFHQPHLVREWLEDDGKVTPGNTREMGKLGIKQEHLDVVKEGMRRVVHEQMGTANGSWNEDRTRRISKWPLTNPEGEEEITICGKTGTAEFGAEDEDGGARDTHGWFTCFAPMDEPEIAVSVVIEAGGEGSVVAVPVADEILRAWFELTGKRERGKVLAKEPMPVPNEDGVIVDNEAPSASPEASPQASPAAPATPDS